jgi:hypothetical protein
MGHGLSKDLPCQPQHSLPQYHGKGLTVIRKVIHLELQYKKKIHDRESKIRSCLLENVLLIHIITTKVNG